jgi:hypothetical protein
MDVLRGTDPLSGDWMALVVVLATGLLGWINVVAPKKWRLLTSTVFGLRLGRQSMRDEVDLQDRTLVALVIMAMGVLALFLYQWGVLYGGGTQGLLVWARIFGLCLALFVGQVLLLRMLGLLFRGDGGSMEYVYTLLLLNVALGVALLPVVALMAWPHQPSWRPWISGLGLFLLGAMLLFRWFRALLCGRGGGLPTGYVLLYLCALEILPVALALQHLREFSF